MTCPVRVVALITAVGSNTADALSRAFMDEIGGLRKTSKDTDEFVSVNLDLDSADFSSIQYQKLISDVNNNPVKSNFCVINNRLYIRLEDSDMKDAITPDYPTLKLVIPEPMRQRLISSAHCPPTSAHLGINKTGELLRRYYFWPTLGKDVRDFVSTCEICKSSKAINYTNRPPLTSFPLTYRPFQRLYIDFLGPYPRTYAGNTGIIIVVDHFSKFVITRAIRQATAQEVVKFLEKNIFLLFGVPETIVSDNGKQFVSNVLSQLLAKYGVKHIFTAKYSPQANASERVNQTLLASLRAYIKDDQRTWDKHLDEVTHALRTVIHESTHYPPYFLVFGHHPIMHGSAYSLLKEVYKAEGNHISIERKPEDLYRLSSIIQKHLQDAQSKAHHSYNLRSRPAKYQIGQTIFVKNFTQSKAISHYSAKLAPKYQMGVIKRLVGNVSCEVSDPNGHSLGIYHFKDIKL